MIEELAVQGVHLLLSRPRMTVFRPCIDLHHGQVKQIVGGTLDTSDLKTNFVSKSVCPFLKTPRTMSPLRFFLPDCLAWNAFFLNCYCFTTDIPQNIMQSCIETTICSVAMSSNLVPAMIKLPKRRSRHGQVCLFLHAELCMTDGSRKTSCT